MQTYRQCLILPVATAVTRSACTMSLPICLHMNRHAAASAPQQQYNEPPLNSTTRQNYSRLLHYNQICLLGAPWLYNPKIMHAIMNMHLSIVCSHYFTQFATLCLVLLRIDQNTSSFYLYVQFDLF